MASRSTPEKTVPVAPLSWKGVKKSAFMRDATSVSALPVAALLALAAAPTYVACDTHSGPAAIPLAALAASSSRGVGARFESMKATYASDANERHARVPARATTSGATVHESAKQKYAVRFA
jgi:hypothetical protein